MFYVCTSPLVLTRLTDVGLNIGAHQEAIEHFLSALAMQESSGGGKSEQLWTTLRRAFQQMVSTFCVRDLCAIADLVNHHLCLVFRAV